MIVVLLWTGVAATIALWGLILFCGINAYRRERGHACWFCGKTYPCDCPTALKR